MTNEERKQASEKILKDKGYKILQFLGQGCVSTVFKCENKQKELVAVKVAIGAGDAIKKEISTTNELNSLKQNGWKKYKGEIEKADKHYYKYINKPIFKEEISSSESIAIFEAPLVSDDLWCSIIKAKTPINYDELRKVSKNVLKALQVVHSKDKAHLDIKPANIFRLKLENGKDVFQLGDFGRMTDTTDENIKKADIFALGRTLLALYIAEIQNQLYILKIGETELPKADECIKDLQANKYQPVSDNPKEKLFLDFVKKLTTTCSNRPNATEALKEPFLMKS